jgi:DNA-binding IclR family transcriptional regulator
LSRVGQKYRLGATLFELGNLHFPAKMRETLQPYLDDLQRVSGGDVALFELVGDHVIALQVSRARNSSSTLLKLGARIPAGDCSGGVVLAAHKTTRPTKEQRAILKMGYLVDCGLGEPKRTSVAAPVFNRRDRVLASLMVSVPATTRNIDLASLINAATSFARTLTYAGKTADVDFLAHALPRPKPALDPEPTRMKEVLHG